MDNTHQPKTLSIDIGGTGVKMMVLDTNGKAITEYLKEPTPKPATKETLSTLISTMIKTLNTRYDRASAGFPGVIENGVIHTAHNLDPSLIGLNFEHTLSEITGVPTRLANDADVQGYGDIEGVGVEMVITLGTGVGSALFIDGVLVPNLELAHHPFIDNKTYEDLLGKAAFEKSGVTQWSEALKKAIAMWAHTFNYHQLYIGGGLSNEIHFDLPERVKKSKNIEGVLGGIRLWAH